MSDLNRRLLPILLALQSLTFVIVIILWLQAPSQTGQSGTGNHAANNNQFQNAVASETISTTAINPDLLREIIRDELAQLTYTPSASSDAVVTTRSIRNLSYDEQKAQENAAAVSLSIVRQAVSAGAWTKSDTDALLPYVGALSEQQRIVLMDELFGAINQQEVDIQDFPPL